jgi:hypothetical protein
MKRRASEDVGREWRKGLVVGLGEKGVVDDPDQGKIEGMEGAGQGGTGPCLLHE